MMRSLCSRAGLRRARAIAVANFSRGTNANATPASRPIANRIPAAIGPALALHEERRLISTRSESALDGRAAGSFARHCITAFRSAAEYSDALVRGAGFSLT